MVTYSIYLFLINLTNDTYSYRQTSDFSYICNYITSLNEPSVALAVISDSQAFVSVMDGVNNDIYFKNIYLNATTQQFAWVRYAA